MVIRKMENKIREYILVNSKSHLVLRGAACSLVEHHIDDIRSELNASDGAYDLLLDIINKIEEY